MAIGRRTTTLFRGSICALAGFVLLAALAFHWHAVAVVFGGYWLARGGLAISRAHTNPARVASLGLVAVLSLVTGLLVVLASPWGTGAGIGLSLALFVGFQALITGTIDMAHGVYDESLSDCGFGLAALWMGTGLWFGPFLGFETAIASMGIGACAIGLGAMVLTQPERRRRLQRLTQP